jgi:undecaprenyl-diphosphatase
VVDLSYLQALVIGALQGVTELFPISSLGHSVLVPALIGGSWQHLVTESSTKNSAQSPYLAFVVALHVATAVALLAFYWHDWVRVIGDLARTVRTRQIRTPGERFAWLIVLATIPVGVIGLALERQLRTVFAKPSYAAAFLFVNGLVLLAGERLRRAAVAGTGPGGPGGSGGSGSSGSSGSSARGVPAAATRRRVEDLSFREAVVVGLFQALALLAGISRSGITMVAGLQRGLDHEDAARFAFMLATPVIFAAGLLKLPTLAGSAGAGIHGQVLLGSFAAAVCAYASVKFLTRYFTTRTLTPFAVYCLSAGAACVLRFG